MIARLARLLCLALVAWTLVAGSPALTLAADAASAAGDHHAPGMRGVPASAAVADWKTDLAVYSFVVFIILMAILTKFAWKPISEALDKREQTVASNIAKAQGAADEAKIMLAQYQQQLAGAADQVRAMLDEARRDAETTKAAIIEEAKKSAEAEHDRAVRDIKTATDSALSQLAEKSADLAVDLAGKVLQAKLTKADHQQLVADGVKKFLAEPSKN